MKKTIGGRMKIFTRPVRIISCAAALSVFLIGCGGSKSGSAGSGKRAKISVEIYDRGTDGGKTDPTNNQWTKWILKRMFPTATGLRWTA
jgi:hypothetical protein